MTCYHAQHLWALVPQYNGRIRGRELLLFILCMDTVFSKTNACSRDCVIYSLMCNRLNNVWVCMLCILYLDGCLL